MACGLVFLSISILMQRRHTCVSTDACPAWHCRLMRILTSVSQTQRITQFKKVRAFAKEKCQWHNHLLFPLLCFPCACSSFTFACLYLFCCGPLSSRSLCACNLSRCSFFAAQQSMLVVAILGAFHLGVFVMMYLLLIDQNVRGVVG